MPTSILERDWGQVAGEGRVEMYEQMHYFNRPDHIINLHPFTITNVAETPAVNYVGGRPCVSLAGISAATDGSNFCYATATHRFIAGKETRIKFGVRFGDATNNAMAAGLSVVTTTLTANHDGGTPATDYLVITKAAGSTVMRLRVRKASGTEETVSLSLTPADNTWYDFEIVALPDASVAGQGRVKVFCQTALGAPAMVADMSVGTNMPDTVSTALAFGARVGQNTNTTAVSYSHIGIKTLY